MITKFFMNKYAMTQSGSKNFIIAILSHTLVNFSRFLPPMIAYLFLSQYLSMVEGINSNIALTVLHYFLIVGAVFIVMFIIARWDYGKLYTTMYKESANIRIDLANRIKKLPLSYFGKRDNTDISTTMMNDLTLYEEIFSHAVPQLYATILSTLVMSISLIAFNWKLGLATISVMPLSILVSYLSKMHKKKYSDSWFKQNRDNLDSFQESIEQIEDIKAYNLESKCESEFQSKLKRIKETKIKLELIYGILDGVSKIILKLGTVIVALVGAYLFKTGEINIIVYATFLMLSTSIYLPIEGVLTFMSMITMLESVVTRIKEIKNMPIQVGKMDMNNNNYDIKYDNVYFGYEDYSVINGVSFVAKQGEITALIGESGSGKSTLAKLAARFWDIDKGKITVGGEDISKIDPETLLKDFAIVFQDVVLFNASIKDNIKIGKQNATDEEILKAAKASRCLDFIDKMPDGIDTIIGENGERLSGGERQRISIARALLKDAPIILMDEATASLDVTNETKIQEALTELIKDKTVIVIAHRMRTIRNADKIILLKKGKIIASGKDKELMRDSKEYRKMVKMSENK